MTRIVIFKQPIVFEIETSRARALATLARLLSNFFSCGYYFRRREKYVLCLSLIKNTF